MKMYEKYEAAQRLLTQHTRTAVLNGRPSILWTDGRCFSYRRQIRGADGVETVTVHVDAETGEEWTEEPQEIRGSGQAGDPKTTSRHTCLCGTDSRSAVRYEQETGRQIGGTGDQESVSPDGSCVLYTENYNLMLRDTRDDSVTPLTTDGEPLREYGAYVDIYSQITSRREGYTEHPLVCWSPDGTHFIIPCADRRACGKLYVIESAADRAEEIRPRLWEYPCPFVGDPDEEIPHYTLYVGNIKKKKLARVDAPDFLYPLFTSPDRSWARWLEDGSGFYFTWIARGFQEGRLYLAAPEDGSTRMLVKENTELFLNLGAFGQLDGYGEYLFSNYVTSDRSTAFWQSERSGYAHLYRYDLEAGNAGGEGPENPESGVDLFGEDAAGLIVQKLIRVDEGQRKIYFMANHVPECSDPLYYQLYVVGFDGSGLTRLTPEDGVHTVSLGNAAFVDTWSRVDQPPVTVLRKLDGTLIRELERADVSELFALGYQIPERFTVKSGDGKTELYGILIRPAEFDPDKTYPLIDYVYGGPQLYNVPREFTWDNSMDREILGGLQEFSRLGFAGIILDGRGTPGRGMEFHSYSYQNLHGCAGLEDHVACAGELKKKFPFLDLDRVGIWGNSGGGYATVSAMLKYPGFYKAGAASSGNYDQRMYEHSWTERYNGRYDEKVYEKGDITRYAGRLEGKLMLAYGAMDDNVSMSQTLRLCDELNRHNKDYELLVLPRQNHNVPSDLYFIRRKLDFFVKNLLGEEPPKEFRFDVFGQEMP